MCLQSRRYLGPVSGHGGVQGVHGANGDPRHVRSDTAPLTGVGQAGPGHERESTHHKSFLSMCLSLWGAGPRQHSNIPRLSPVSTHQTRQWPHAGMQLSGNFFGRKIITIIYDIQSIVGCVLYLV